MEQMHVQPTDTGSGLVRNAASEEQLWSYLVQLASALRAVHSAGLACRAASLAPSKVRNKLRHALESEVRVMLLLFSGGLMLAWVAILWRSNARMDTAQVSAETAVCCCVRSRIPLRPPLSSRSPLRLHPGAGFQLGAAPVGVAGVCGCIVATHQRARGAAAPAEGGPAGARYPLHPVSTTYVCQPT